MTTKSLNPGRMTSIGDLLLDAVKGATISLSELRPSIERFRKAHGAYIAMEKRVSAKHENEINEHLSHGDLDATAEVLIDALTVSLITDGFARANPFQGMSKLSPSKLKELAVEKQIAACIELGLAVAKSKKASAKSKSVAKTLIATSRELQAAGKKLVSARNATHVDRQNRDSIGNEWTKAYSLLKMKAKFVQASTGNEVFDLLFPKAPKKVKTVAPPTTPTV